MAGHQEKSKRRKMAEVSLGGTLAAVLAARPAASPPMSRP
jgi:hypothetical protein